MNKKYLAGIGAVITASAYIVLGYFTARSNFMQLIFIFGILFALYFLLLKYKEQFTNLKWLIALAVLFRIILLFQIPNLSDDYFRFIWDGRLLAHGNNPFLFLPSQIINTDFSLQNNLSPELFNGLNSKIYYTCYPPVHQFIFGISALLAPDNIPGSIILMRLFILLAESGIFILLIKLLKQLGMKENLFLMYAFNPLVIIELTGNLHFEAIMIFFLFLSIYLLIKEKLFLSAAAFSFAVGIKLLPLIFLPLLIRKLGWKNGILFSGIAFGILALMFLPFLNQALINNFFSSINLYFQKFEFNASIYFLVRWLGFQVMGYNIIAAAGIVLSALTFLIIVYIAFSFKGVNSNSFLLLMLFTITTYFLFATTVHPWYLVTLIAVGIFTQYKFAIAWSALSILSYYAYQTFPYKENFWLISIEYLVVAFYFIHEYRANPFNSLKSISQKNFNNGMVGNF